ncbi:hypothetical protein MLD38_015222 [Melastoma candidum]|uniref:Uncharacterized protein n=1 Tax=Melastoma candidum TaxID=119954 RepID=A0ACB9RF83_9MYRT|nr:hypothetical protein MLD38_015222 [Melastoma candidum]
MGQSIRASAQSLRVPDFVFLVSAAYSRIHRHFRRRRVPPPPTPEWRRFCSRSSIRRLRYDDLYDPYYNLDIKEALNGLPKEIVDARHQRLKRAVDLSMKHQYLPEDLQVMR